MVAAAAARVMAKAPTKDEAERLEALHAILINPKRSIGSIQILAAEHGFTDLPAFNTLFHERYGSSPVALRKFAKKKSKGRR